MLRSSAAVADFAQDAASASRLTKGAAQLLRGSCRFSRCTEVSRDSPFGRCAYAAALELGNSCAVVDRIEPLMSGRLDQLIESAAVLQAWDGMNEGTWNANHNACQSHDILEAFRSRRQLFVGRLDELPEKLVERSALHPRLESQCVSSTWRPSWRSKMVIILLEYRPPSNSDLPLNSDARTLLERLSRTLLLSGRHNKGNC